MSMRSIKVLNNNNPQHQANVISRNATGLDSQNRDGDLATGLQKNRIRNEDEKSEDCESISDDAIDELERELAALENEENQKIEASGAFGMNEKIQN